jgi:hypothetical protein
MPLALQALLPFFALVIAAAVVRQRPRQPANGWIAAGATGLAGIIALVELVRLAPGEHVDVPYLTTFPYADLAIRLDGLSLGFATVTLLTAALLMLARQQVRGDRRDPWFSWLLTSAAVCAVIFAHNLLLVYIALQALTLAWSGALDETAPRRRRLRLSIQIADIGLLLAAASAIQSVGTSAFSGVPSDTFGLATFLLVLLPVVARLLALPIMSSGPPAPVAFEPAIAWVAPAGYLLMRLLALMGGRLPDRATAVALFSGGVLVAVAFGALAVFERVGPRLAALLLGAQAALALALSAGSDPLLTVASAWLWLLLVPLAGLAGIRVPAGSSGEGLRLINLGMLPGSIAFAGLWLGGLALNARGLPAAILPVGLAVILAMSASLSRVVVARSLRWDVATIWAAILLAIAAVPVVVIDPLVLPAAATVRAVPGGTIAASLLGIVTPDGAWPALAISLAVALALALGGWRLQRRLPLRPPERGKALSILRRPGIALPGLPPVRPWSRLLLWGAFAIVAGIVVTRP